MTNFDYDEKALREIIAQNCVLNEENSALQKQVDELLNRRIEPKIFQCHADTLENCPKVKQAVKDTAKEIFTDLFEEVYEYDDTIHFECLSKCTLKKIAERYGVEL